MAYQVRIVLIVQYSNKQTPTVYIHSWSCYLIAYTQAERGGAYKLGHEAVLMTTSIPVHDHPSHFCIRISVQGFIQDFFLGGNVCVQES